MTEKLVSVYGRFNVADMARNALIASGFPSDRLELTCSTDEAGPVEGNFALDYKDTARDHDHSLLDSLFGRDETNKGLAYQNVGWRGTCMLVVEVEDEVQKRRALDITQKFQADDDAER